MSSSFHFVRPSIFIVICMIFITQQSCATTSPQQTSPPTQRPYIINNIKYHPIPSSAGYMERGIASWYGPDFHGKTTSNGERYNMHGPTAAHKLLPMNTMLLVKNLENGREAVVRINDRGPFVRGRIIDLSYSTAQSLGILERGTARVEIVALAPALMANANENFQVDFNNGEFYIQIGSFSQKSNALRLQKRFVDSGHNAVIQQYSASDATYYRVQVYAGSQLQRARQAEQALLSKGYSDAFIVAR